VALRSGLMHGALCTVLLSGAAAALELRTTNGVSFVSGGIGSDERAEMALALPDYNLKVATAAKRSGEYVAGVVLEVRDTGGKILFDTVLDGPWLLARLPAGTYELRLTHRDQTQTTKVSIPAQGRRDALFYWDVGGVEVLKASAEERGQAAR
jgi:hypothetical protein